MEKSLDHLAVLQDEKTGLYHGAYYRNKPTPSGCVRFILSCTTIEGFADFEAAATAIEKAFPDMEKIPRENQVKAQ